MKLPVLIGIGKGYEYQIDWAIKYTSLTAIEAKKALIFDMHSYPKRKDALDFIEMFPNKLSMVTLFHIYGVAKKEKSLNKDYFYNNRNRLFPIICKKTTSHYI